VVRAPEGGAKVGVGVEGGDDGVGDESFNAVTAEDGLVFVVADEQVDWLDVVVAVVHIVPSSQRVVHLEPQGGQVEGGLRCDEDVGGGGVECEALGLEVRFEAGTEVGADGEGLRGGHVEGAGLEDGAVDRGFGDEVGVDIDCSGAFAGEGDVSLGK
jgi:hypothetical protein